MLPPVLSRRELLALPLALGAASVLAACTGDGPETPDPQAVADVAALERALSAERELLAKATDSAVAPAVLSVHVDVLASTLQNPSASPPTSTPSDAAPAPLRPEDLRAVAEAHLADLDTVTGPVARLLASVAASDLALAQTWGQRL